MLRKLSGAMATIRTGAALAALWSGTAVSAELYTQFPAEIEPDARYVFYSHGLIVEGDDPRPVHPQFGTYDFPAIRAALFDGGGYNVIAHHRPANTDIDAYVEQLASWVRALLDAGVEPKRITLIGFSRGAHLTALTAAQFADAGINTALMGLCLDGSVRGYPDLRLGGNLLSIFEETDVVKSCAELARNSLALESFEEIAIDTGLSHGAFYEPLDVWMTPLREWVSRTNR